MRINRFKLFIFFIPLLLPILLFFVFKRNVVIYFVESSVKNNGGEIKIEHLSTPLFSNSYTFKGEIITNNSNIKLNKITRDYNLFNSSNTFAYIKIEGGVIKFKGMEQEKKLGKFPHFNLVAIKDFDVILPNNGLNFRLDDLEIRDLAHEEIVPKFSFIKLKLSLAKSKIQIDSSDGKTLKVFSPILNIDDIRQFLPAYSSIIKSASLSFEAESKYPELLEDGYVKLKIHINDFNLKDEKNLNFIEKLYNSNLQYKLDIVKQEGVSIDLKIGKENYHKRPAIILQEYQSKLINEILSKIFKL
jgi:hypothetical protein